MGDRKQITDAKERDEINFALDEIMKNPPDALSQEFLGKLSDLKDNINQEFVNNQVAESVDSIAKESLSDTSNFVSRLSFIDDEHSWKSPKYRIKD